MPRRDLSERADRLRTLLIFAVLQAFLVSVSLRLLPITPEEAGIVKWAAPWLAHLGATDALWTLRLVSAIVAVCSTIMMERLWLGEMTADTRQWVLLFWTFSPAILLNARMAQTYTLQVLLVVLIGAAQRHKPKILGALLVFGVITAGYLTQSQHALQNLPYAFYALAFGECMPVWLLALSAILIVPYILVLYRAASNHRQWLLPGAAVAVLGCAIEGPHAIFLMPLLTVAVTTGIEESGRLGIIFGIALFAANAGGVWTYYGGHDFIDPAYASPQPQITAAITGRSNPSNTQVWSDGMSIEGLPAGIAVRVLHSPADADAAWTDLQRTPNIRHIWFIRHSDAFDTLEQRLTGSFPAHAMHPYDPLPETYRLEQKYLKHIPDPPRYQYQVWEFLR